MTGLITKATLLTAGGMLVAAAAMAGIPYLPSCTLTSSGNSSTTGEGHIILSAVAAGAPDTVSGNFTVLVRDLALNPVFQSKVTVDLSNVNGVTKDIRMASNQMNVNYTVDCVLKTVTAYTNINGLVTFNILGGAVASPSTYSAANGGRIYIDNVLFKSPTVAADDLTGSNGITGGDFALWLGDLQAYTLNTVTGYRARSDYTGEGVIAGGDFALWLGALARAGGGTTSATPVCTP